MKCLRYTDIIWDFDGTLFDTYPKMVNSFKRALLDEGITADQEEILSYMKVSAKDALLHYKSRYSIREGFMERFQKYEKDVKAEEVHPFPYAEEVCIEIKELGGRNFIVTHRGESTMDILKYHGMLGLFIEVVTKNNGFKRKPDPEAFQYIIDKYNINKKKALIVGDREFEAAAAKAVGVKSCLYDTNKVDRITQPEYYIQSLKELYEVIL